MKITRLDQIPLDEDDLLDDDFDLDRSDSAGRGASSVPWEGLLTERTRAIPTEKDATYLDLECLADIDIEPMESVWGSVVTRGCVTVLAGEPGIGKSLVALDIAATVTTCQARRRLGSDCEDLSRMEPLFGSLGEPKRVLICSPRHERGSTLVRRLTAAKADLSFIQTINGVREAEDIDRDGSRWAFQLDRDLAILESELMLLRGGEQEIGLVVIDPFPDGHFIGARQALKLHDMMSRLAEIASCCQVGILLVCDALSIDDAKRAKSVTAYPAIERIAQSVWVVERDPDSDKGRLLLPAKSQLEEEPSALSFSINNKTVAWKAEEVSMTAQEFRLAMLQRRRNPLLFEDASELARATDWLHARLACGPVQSWRIKQEAAENEISYATLRRAFSGLRCESKQIDGSRRHEWGAAGTFHARRMTGSGRGDLSPGELKSGEGRGTADIEEWKGEVQKERGGSLDCLSEKLKAPKRESGFRAAAVPAHLPASFDGALDGTWTTTMGVHEHVLEHQFERVLGSVNHEVSGELGIGVHGVPEMAGA